MPGQPPTGDRNRIEPHGPRPEMGLLGKKGIGSARNTGLLAGQQGLDGTSNGIAGLNLYEAHHPARGLRDEVDLA